MVFDGVNRRSARLRRQTFLWPWSLAPWPWTPCQQFSLAW